MPEQPTESVSEAQAALGRASERTKHLISSGRLEAATVDLLKLGRPQDAPHTLSISEALHAQRSAS